MFDYLPLTLLDLFNQTPDRYKLGYGKYKIPNTKIGNGTQKSVDKETWKSWLVKGIKTDKRRITVQYQVETKPYLYMDWQQMSASSLIKLVNSLQNVQWGQSLSVMKGVTHGYSKQMKEREFKTYILTLWAHPHHHTVMQLFNASPLAATEGGRSILTQHC